MSAVAYLQIVGGAGDTGPSAFIFTDDKRYLFNCGEGIQRFCMEHKIRLKQVSDIFFTQSSWECLGGLPGMLLTMQDMYQVSNPVALHGPPHLTTMMEGTKTFMQHRSSLFRDLEEFSGPVSEFDDGRLKMKVFTIHADASEAAVPEAAVEPMHKHNYMLTAAPVSEQIGAQFDHHAEHVPAKKAKPEAPAGRKSQQPSQSPTHSDQETASTVPKTSDGGGKETPANPLHTTADGSNTRDNSSSSPGSNSSSKQDQLRPPTVDAILDAARSTQQVTLAYIGALVNPRLGKFNVSKAKSTGVPKGPLWGELGKGNNVTLEDGRVVTPQDVLDPVDPLPHFAILHTPNMASVHGLLATGAVFEEFRSHPGKTPTVVHFAPQEVVESSAYAQVLQRLGNNVMHVFVDPAHNPHATTTAATKLQYMLQVVGPSAFATAAVPDTIPEIHVPHALPEGCTVLSGRPLFRTFLSKRRDGLWKDDSYCLPPLPAEECRQSLMQLPGFVEELRRLQPAPYWQPRHTDGHGQDFGGDVVEMNKPTQQQPQREDDEVGANMSSSDMRAAHASTDLKNERVLHFMGTGSAVPSQLRNVTCMLLTRGVGVTPDGVTTVDPAAASMLLDCGEGSLSQLHRKFGGAHVPSILRSLRLVHISHMHADHHLGLTRILTKRREAFEAVGRDPPPVVVVAPLYLWLFMRYTAHLTLDNSVYVDARWTRFSGRPLPKHVPAHVRKAYAAACVGMGIRAIATPLVKHCHAAHGLVLDFEDGYRFAWSGDTRPCKPLVTAGRGADLLVHEATFEDGLEDQAVAKNHSTTSDAVRVAREMGAKSLMLTHFSQRYPQIPVVADESREHTAFGFDLMSVPLACAREMASMTPAIDVMFAAFKPEDEDVEPAKGDGGAEVAVHGAQGKQGVSSGKTGGTGVKDAPEKKKNKQQQQQQKKRKATKGSKAPAASTALNRKQQKQDPHQNHQLEER